METDAILLQKPMHLWSRQDIDDYNAEVLRLVAEDEAKNAVFYRQQESLARRLTRELEQEKEKARQKAISSELARLAKERKARRDAKKRAAFCASEWLTQ